MATPLQGKAAPAACAPKAPDVHEQLTQRAEQWLYQRGGCGVVLREPFRAHTHTGERPDAIGWREGLSVLVECKASRSDFFADGQKPFRQDPALGAGDWRFFLCPPKLIYPEEIPQDWGLLWCYPRQIRAQTPLPDRAMWYRARPFRGNEAVEREILYAALRRVQIRGHLGDAYAPLLSQT